MDIYIIAKYFLNKDKSMTQRKLQGLCYYSYAWWYTFYKNELFPNNFEAWVHGPTDSQLYSVYKYNESKNILESDDITFLDLKLFLEEVWECYGQYTGLELESIIHQELPWQRARVGFKSYEPCTTVIIKNEDILEEYSNRC